MISRAREKNRTDRELMSLLADGEMEPLGELYVRYGGAVRTLLLRVLEQASREEADDLCHEVFVTVSAIADRFDRQRELRPWLYGIAVRKARAWERKRRLRSWILGRYAGERREDAALAIAAPDAQTASRRQIDRALAALPLAQREVLILHVVEGMGGEQIAELLGVNLNTVWTRLRRARMAMRGALGSAGPDSRMGG